MVSAPQWDNYIARFNEIYNTNALIDLIMILNLTISMNPPKALFFSEQEIDAFRDCFYLNCKSGTISDLEQLKFVMRSVGLSPNINELKSFLELKKNNIRFADFLDCAHVQQKSEKIPDEIMKAFRVSPFVNNQNISVDTLRHLLCNYGEKLTNKEFNTLLKELNVNTPEISYKQFVNSLVITNRVEA